MLLKTVHQWDICNQEDLAAFREESEAIHNGAIRTLYQKDPYADPGQRKEEERANRTVNQRTRRRGVTQPEENTEKESATALETHPIQEQDETVSDADLVSNIYPSREEFLTRLASDLEHRKNPESDGYSIVVQAVVEHRRDGMAVRAEFVETEGPRLAHMRDPNLGRILDVVSFNQWEESYLIEDPDGSIRISESPFPCVTKTIELLHQQGLEKSNKWVLQWLLRPQNDWYRLEELYEMEEIGEMREGKYLKKQRDRIGRQIQKQAAKP